MVKESKPKDIPVGLTGETQIKNEGKLDKGYFVTLPKNFYVYTVH